MPRVLLDYLRLFRAPAVFTALSNILAAHLIATGGQPDWAMLALLGPASMALYMAGMVLNDCFDFAEDSLARPSRPLPSARISLPMAWMLGWALLALGVALAGLAGRVQFFIGLLLAGAIVAYDGWAKKGLLGPIAMGGCRYLNWLLGLSVAGLDGKAFALALPIFLYVLSLTILSSEETSARRPAVVYASASGLLACAISIAALHAGGAFSHHWALMLLAMALAYMALRLRETKKNFTPAGIQGTMKILILGIIPLDALLVFSGAPWGGGLLVASLLIPGRLLARRMSVT